MKKLLLGLLASLAISAAARADIITLWNFNFPSPESGSDTNPVTGTFAPWIGSGTFTNIGGTTNSFGNPPSGQLATSDTWTNNLDNSAFRLGVFPAAGAVAQNKTAGVRFFSSTLGYENIKITWDQENSATASKYWRAQYTINGGTNWVDTLPVILTPGGTAWQKGLQLDLSGVSGVKDNTNFGFRLVSEIESTANGGAPNFVGNSGTYGVNGTLWVDMVTLSGTLINTNNTDPTITAIPNQSIRVNQALSPVAFTIGDAETSAGNLVLSVVSSQSNLIQNITFGGSGANRTVSLVPEANQSGAATLTVTVTDEGGKIASSSFNVQVRPPVLVITNQTLRVSTSRAVNFLLSDSESFQGTVNITADAPLSSNPNLLPDGSLVLSGSGSNRTLTITPAPNELGYAFINVTATDGALTASTNIFFRVVDTNLIALWDFNSKLRDLNVLTGDPTPIYGNGTASVCGTAVGALNMNITTTSSDPDQQDDTNWRIDKFPTQGTSNKTSGVQFVFSTVGFQNIAMSWEHYNSATASRYWRLQYTLDGVNYTDHSGGFTNPVEVTFHQASASFADIPGANNNPNFGVRLVSELDTTGATTNYIGTQSSGGYSVNGTLWLDGVTFSGEPVVVPPTLTASKVGDDVQVSWTTNSAGYLLENTLNLGGAWATNSQTPIVSGSNYVVTITNAQGNQFFRLYHP